MPLPESLDEIVAIVADDVAGALGAAFPGELSLVEDLADVLPIGSTDVTAVPWTWRGRHLGPPPDVRATGNPVEIVGVTILRDRDGELVFHRIVDWQALYRQLGLVMVCRRPRDPDAEDVDTIDRFDPDRDPAPVTA